MMKAFGVRRMYQRLLSREYFESVTPELVKAEIARLMGELERGQVALEDEKKMEVGVVVRHAMSQSGENVIGPALDLAERANVVLGTKFDISSLCGFYSKNAPESVLLDTWSMKTLLTQSCNDDFSHLLYKLNCFLADRHERNLHSIPPQIVQLIPVVEAEIIKRSPTFSLADACGAVYTIGRLKLANPAVFQAVIDPLIRELSERVASGSTSFRPMKASTGLALIRELGWAGYMHSGLTPVIAPLFEKFRNYQALSSVFMIYGGLNRAVVDICMNVVRSDRNNKEGDLHVISLQSHCGLIRRLVACGFFEEAMELFNHFPREAYEGLNDPTVLSQVYRLYLASYLRPDIVDPEQVKFLHQVMSKHELARQPHGRGSDNGGPGMIQQSSYVHKLAVDALSKLGIDHVSEYEDPKTLSVIDIFVPSLNLAIEVEGPSHYITDLATGTRVMRPEDEFKIKVLEKAGIRVECLSVFDFGRNYATRNAVERIEEILKQYERTE